MLQINFVLSTAEEAMIKFSASLSRCQQGSDNLFCVGNINIQLFKSFDDLFPDAVGYGRFVIHIGGKDIKLEI